MIIFWKCFSFIFPSIFLLSSVFNLCALLYFSLLTASGKECNGRKQEQKKPSLVSFLKNIDERKGWEFDLDINTLLYLK